MAVAGYSTEGMRVRPSPKMLIVCQDAHAGDTSLLVSFLGALGAHTGQERTASAICLFSQIRRATQAM